MFRLNGGTLSTNPNPLLLDIAYRLDLHLTFLHLVTGSTWLFIRFCYHTPGRTDCTSGNLRIYREVSIAHCSNVVREVIAGHCSNVDREVSAAICSKLVRELSAAHFVT